MNEELAHSKALLTVAEAAVMLGIGRSFLYSMVLSGEMPSIKLGRARRIPVGAIRDFIDQKLSEEFPEIVRG